jgi:hypothetical protein
VRERARRANGGAFLSAQSPYSQFAEAPGECEWHGIRRTWLSRAGEDRQCGRAPLLARRGIYFGLSLLVNSHRARTGLGFIHSWQ